MRRNATIKCLLLIMVSVFLHADTRAQVNYYASVPYATGFETNVLDSNWYTHSSLPGGRIRIWPSDTLIYGGDTAQAHTGNFWLGLDNGITTGTYIQKEAWMGLNAAGQSGLRLAFAWAEWNDETETQDGVFISSDSGNSFIKVLNLQGDLSTDLAWHSYDLDLDSINAAHGLTYTGSYVIKFQEYDNYYFAGGNDGFMFDDISVGTGVTAIQQSEVSVLSLYPNPSNGSVYLRGLNVKNDIHVAVKNILGETVPCSINWEQISCKIEWAGNPGIYLIEVNDGAKSQMYKVMKY